MKENIHPKEYREVVFKDMSNDEIFITRSTVASKETITVDGKEYRFKKVWLAPTMHGRFYGGGMMPTPAQDRLDPEGKLSVMVMHGSGKLKTLMIFPPFFTGKQKLVDTAGRVDKFRSRYGNRIKK